MKNNLPFIALCLLVLFVSAGRSNETFDKVQVREFSLVDDKGTQRVSIKVEDDGEVMFRMFDGNHTIRVKLGGGANGSGLVLLDDETNPGVQILSKQEGGKLNLVDANGKKKEY